MLKSAGRVGDCKKSWSWPGKTSQYQVVKHNPTALKIAIELENKVEFPNESGEEEVNENKQAKR